MAEITRHFTSAVYIVFNNKVLLHKHKKYDLILPVGGHIDRDELPHEAALREAKEEAGLTLELYNSNKIEECIDNNEKELNRGEHLNLHFVNTHHQHAEFVFYAKSRSSKFKPKKGESKDLNWYTKEEIETSTFIKKAQKMYALEALKFLKD